MSRSSSSGAGSAGAVRTERVYRRFTLAQRWEHGLLVLSFTVLFLTGAPQKYFDLWGHLILTTPERIVAIRQVHLAAAIVLLIEVLYHLLHGIWLMAKRSLPGDIFPTVQDLRDAWDTIKYLLFLRPRPPVFGKYNFEQKFTYWFIFIGIGIMVITGLVLWFPIAWTRIFPGGIIPAARLAHSTEAVVATIFVLIWHFYHVHAERLNLSIFTGRLTEREMRQYHYREYQRLTAGSNPTSPETQDLEQGDTP